jgi:acetyltransferase
VIAVGRLSKLHRRDEAELAVLVHDGFQHLGMGTELYRRLITVARNEKLRRLVSTVLAENHEMRAICQKLGFQMKADMEEGTLTAVLEL